MEWFLGEDLCVYWGVWFVRCFGCVGGGVGCIVMGLGLSLSWGIFGYLLWRD